MAIKNTPQDLDAVLKEIANASSARTAVLIATNLLDYSLELLLSHHLRKPSEQDAWELFTDNGIFGTLSRKIMGAYYLRLIGPLTRRDLDLMRRMRNECAHNMNPITFATPAISSRCRELRAFEPFRGSKSDIESEALQLCFALTAVALHAKMYLEAVPAEIKIQWAPLLREVSQGHDLPPLSE